MDEKNFADTQDAEPNPPHDARQKVHDSLTIIADSLQSLIDTADAIHEMPDDIAAVFFLDFEGVIDRLALPNFRDLSLIDRDVYTEEREDALRLQKNTGGPQEVGEGYTRVTPYAGSKNNTCIEGPPNFEMWVARDSSTKPEFVVTVKIPELFTLPEGLREQRDINLFFADLSCEDLHLARTCLRLQRHFDRFYDDLSAISESLSRIEQNTPYLSVAQKTALESLEGRSWPVSVRYHLVDRLPYWPKPMGEPREAIQDLDEEQFAYLCLDHDPRLTWRKHVEHARRFSDQIHAVRELGDRTSTSEPATSERDAQTAEQDLLLDHSGDQNLAKDGPLGQGLWVHEGVILRDLKGKNWKLANHLFQLMPQGSDIVDLAEPVLGDRNEEIDKGQLRSRQFRVNRFFRKHRIDLKVCIRDEYMFMETIAEKIPDNTQ